MSETLITWAQRRGQIKHLLYELCLVGRIDKATLAEQFNDLNKVMPVVKCKDCAYGVKTTDVDIFWCSQYDNAHYDTFYCAEGERKESDNADSDTDSDDI